MPPASLQLLEGLCTEVTGWSSRRRRVYMGCAALTTHVPPVVFLSLFRCGRTTVTPSPSRCVIRIMFTIKSPWLPDPTPLPFSAAAEQYGGSAAMHRVDSHVRRGGGNDTAGGAPPTPTAASGRGLCGAHPVAPAPGASEPHDSEKSEPSSLFAAIVGHSPGRAPEAEGEREYVLSGGAKNAVVAVQRYYSNISTDFERQQVRTCTCGEGEGVPVRALPTPLMPFAFGPRAHHTAGPRGLI